MRGKLRRWWGSLEGFDKVGAAICTWELATLATSVLLLPLAWYERGSLIMYLLLAANLVGLGTALIAWLLTLVLAPSPAQKARQETLQAFIEREVQTFRTRRAGNVRQRA